MTTRKPKKPTESIFLTYDETGLIHFSLLRHEHELDQILQDYENCRYINFPVHFNGLEYQNIEDVKEALDLLDKLIKKIKNTGSTLYNKIEAKRLAEEKKELNQ